MVIQFPDNVLKICIYLVIKFFDNSLKYLQKRDGTEKEYFYVYKLRGGSR